MANRMISYGYGYKAGEIIVLDNEAKVVKQIFNDYISGKTMQEIARGLIEREIEFFNGKCNWNKNSINRIIENRKYIGESGYPEIVSLDVFEMANKMKTDRGHPKTSCSALIEHIKNITYCAECGDKLYRRPKWRIRERWICPSKCELKNYVDDNVLLTSIKTAILRLKSLSIEEVDVSEPTYQKTQEIMRYTNEITRIMNMPNPSFKSGKHLIYACANLKFQACKENKVVSLSENVTNFFSAENVLSVELLKKIVQKVKANNDGKITVVFISGIEIVV